MPYKVVGSLVYHQKGGKWSIKQRCSSHANALKAVGLLHMKGYGSNEGNAYTEHLKKGKT